MHSLLPEAAADGGSGRSGCINVGKVIEAVLQRAEAMKMLPREQVLLRAPFLTEWAGLSRGIA